MKITLKTKVLAGLNTYSEGLGKEVPKAYVDAYNEAEQLFLAARDELSKMYKSAPLLKTPLYPMPFTRHILFTDEVKEAIGYLYGNWKNTNTILQGRAKKGDYLNPSPAVSTQYPNEMTVKLTPFGGFSFFNVTNEQHTVFLMAFKFLSSLPESKHKEWRVWEKYWLGYVAELYSYAPDEAVLPGGFSAGGLGSFPDVKVVKHDGRWMVDGSFKEAQSVQDWLDFRLLYDPDHTKAYNEFVESAGKNYPAYEGSKVCPVPDCSARLNSTGCRVIYKVIDTFNLSPYFYTDSSMGAQVGHDWFMAKHGHLLTSLFDAVASHLVGAQVVWPDNEWYMMVEVDKTFTVELYNEEESVDGEVFVDVGFAPKGDEDFIYSYVVSDIMKKHLAEVGLKVGV